jgi:murein DD-endopeptidase MepM/ murein hydrolase activator NlpD
MIKLRALKNNQKIRGCNSSGCGAFGASRGSRVHNGVDVIAAPYTNIFAPFDGVLLRKGYRIYSSSKPELTGIEIKSDTNYKSKLFYVTTNLPIGHSFKAGDVIAQVQNMKQYYTNPEMPNHVHKELRNPSGKVVDFTNWFSSPTVSAIGIVGLFAAFAGITYGVSSLEPKAKGY